MRRRTDWKRLVSYGRRLGVMTRVLRADVFADRYDPDVLSLYDSRRRVVYVNQAIAADEETTLFALAHEFGHAVDDISSPERGEEYGIHCRLARAHHEAGLETPEETMAVFREREETADEIGLGILSELGIMLPDGFRPRMHG